MGAAEFPGQNIRQLAAKYHPSEAVDERHERGFEVTFDFTDGVAKIGYEKSADPSVDSKPTVHFKGQVHIDTSAPFYTEQRFAPGVTARLQSQRISADFFGELILDGDLVSVAPMAGRGKTTPNPIEMELVGSGELTVDSKQIVDEEGRSLIPSAAPDFNWTAQFDSAAIASQVRGFEILLAPNGGSPGNIKPQLNALHVVGMSIVLNDGRSDFGVSQGGLELARNIWSDIGGSTIQVSHFDASLITDKDFFSRGLFVLDLHDNASRNRLSTRLDFSEGKESDPFVDIYLEDPYGANQLAFTFGQQ